MSLDFKKKLRMASKTWKKAKEEAKSQSTGGNEVEDGRYLAQVTSAEITESQSSGRLQVSWKYVIVDGEYKDQAIYNYDGIESLENQKWFALKMSRKFGYDMDSLEDELEDILKEITKEKPLAKIRVVTKGEFQNVYVDKVLGKKEDENGGEEETEETEETVNLEVGMDVSFKFKGEEMEGEIVRIRESEGKVLVKTEDGKKVWVAGDDVTVLEEESEAEEEETEEEEVPEEPETEEESEDDEDEDEDEEEEEEEDEEEPAPRKKKVEKKTSSLKKKKR